MVLVRYSDERREQLINKIREQSTRTFYSGVYRLDSGLDFDKRLHKFIGDLIEKEYESFSKYITGLY